MRQYCDRGQPDSTPGMRPLPFVIAYLCCSSRLHPARDVSNTTQSQGHAQKSSQAATPALSLLSADGIHVEKGRVEAFLKAQKADQLFLLVDVICFYLSCCFSFLCMGLRVEPESCVFWHRGGNDVDRRGNNNENTIKPRLHRISW